MKQSTLSVFKHRPDLSPYLIHLTKRTETCSAIAVLKSILLEGKIKGSTNETGFIRGRIPAACFMDVPIPSLKYILNEENTDPKHPRYEPYGILTSKTRAYESGARPVLYLSEQEISKLNLPSDELWRVVRLEGVNSGDINWLHEREWRCPNDFHLPSEILGVIVKNTAAAKDIHEYIYKHKEEFASIPKSILPLSIVCQELVYLHPDA
jgi:hypothetical protein